MHAVTRFTTVALVFSWMLTSGGAAMAAGAEDSARFTEVRTDGGDSAAGDDVAVGQSELARQGAQPATPPKSDISLALVPAISETQTVMDAIMLSEPPLRAAVASALRYADYDTGDVQSWRKNVRRRNWLPEFRARAGQIQRPVDVFETANAGTTQVNDIHLSDREANLTSFQFEARWKLGKVLFDQEQIQISEEARRLSSQRNKLIRDISKLYYERMALLIQQREEAESMDRRHQISLTLDLLRTTEVLNQLCGEPLFHMP